MAIVGQGLQFMRGLRTFLRQPAPTLEQARAELRNNFERRDERFLAVMDDLVWPVPTSPYRLLLRAAGLERDDVAELVMSRGLDGALTALRDSGVYVSYREWQGAIPIQRGATSFDVRPEDFFNPLLAADFLGSTGASRSGGTAVATTFHEMTDNGPRWLLRLEAEGAAGAPIATWLPVLPSSAGLTSVLKNAGVGRPPERWFTQVEPALRGIALEKRLSNVLLPLVGRSVGLRIPRPEFASAADAAPVLQWALDAIQRTGRAFLATYASSAVRLAELAAERGARLDGLSVRMTGEPVTAAKAAALRGVGAMPFNNYGFMQKGGVASSCAHRPDEDLHLYADDTALITRAVTRPDGVGVDAFLWTTLATSTRSVFINVENDDYGLVRQDESPCACEWGQLGFRTTVSNIRGISKVVTGGVTVSSDVLVALAEEALPAAVGGGPLDYQFGEEEVGGESRLVLRIDPRIGDVDVDQAMAIVRSHLRRSEVGLLADEVWAPARSLRVERVAPHATRSGKVLTFEGLAPPA
jgi:hypothetical protein